MSSIKIMSVCPPNHVYVMLQSMSSYCCGLAVVEEGDPGEWVGEAGGIMGGRGVKGLKGTGG